MSYNKILDVINSCENLMHTKTCGQWLGRLYLTHSELRAFEDELLRKIHEIINKGKDELLRLDKTK